MILQEESRQLGVHGNKSKITLSWWTEGAPPCKARKWFWEGGQRWAVWPWLLFILQRVERTSGTAACLQVQGPEFNTQYCQKKKCGAKKTDWTEQKPFVLVDIPNFLKRKPGTNGH
jgi:hypothetical protein